MPNLSGLPGLSLKSVEAGVFRTATAAIRILKRNVAATAAGDNGAINVWRDDEGMLRGEFMRRRVTVMSYTCRSKREMYMVLKDWIPQLEAK